MGYKWGWTLNKGEGLSQSDSRLAVGLEQAMAAIGIIVPGAEVPAGFFGEEGDFERRRAPEPAGHEIWARCLGSRMGMMRI